MYTENQYTEFSESMEKRFSKMFEGKYGGFAIGTGWWPIVESLCVNIQSHIDHKEKQGQPIKGRRA